MQPGSSTVAQPVVIRKVSQDAGITAPGTDKLPPQTARPSSDDVTQPITPRGCPRHTFLGPTSRNRLVSMVFFSASGKPITNCTSRIFCLQA